MSVRLDFYVDDIRQEHFERRERVLTDITMEIQRRFKEEGIEIG